MVKTKNSNSSSGKKTRNTKEAEAPENKTAALKKNAGNKSGTRTTAAPARAATAAKSTVAKSAAGKSAATGAVGRTKGRKTAEDKTADRLNETATAVGSDTDNSETDLGGALNAKVPKSLLPASLGGTGAGAASAVGAGGSGESDSDDGVSTDVVADNELTADGAAALTRGDTVKTVLYPLITLRSIIITPASNVQLIAARENTVQALEEALHSNSGGIAVFSQLQSGEHQTFPAKNDLSRIGVLARVLNGFFNEKEQYRATIRGYSRITIRRIIDNPSDPVRHVEVELLEEQKVDPIIEQRYVEAIRSALDNALEIQRVGGRLVCDKNIPAEMIATIRDQDSLSSLTDGLSQVLMLPYFDKKYVLESLDPVARAKAVIAFLNNFSYKAEVDKKIAEDARAAMERSQREFYLNEQLKAIRRELNVQMDDSNDIEEYNNRLQTLDAPDEVINRLQKEISRLTSSGMNNSENSMIRNYIDTLFSIPWRKSTTLNRDLRRARDVLAHDHYGLDKVKDRILEFLAVQSRKEQVDAHGQILCLMGPPGIGKTSLAASIARATGRKYVRVALGGMYDESEIRGHRRTYIGAMPGRIVQSLIRCEVNNPLFLLDEIDKISNNTYHGDIGAALLEVLDPEQNRNFNDNYVDIECDLSHVLFIATANSSNIPPALQDRMEIIRLSSYTTEEKFHIAREHLLPKQLEKNGLTEDEFDISDEGLDQLITHYTMEAGVRSLERIIAELCRKVVKDLMLNPPKKPKKIVLGVKEIEKLIGPKRYDYTSKLKENKVGVVNGLSVSSIGGDMLQVEVIANEGKGSHLLTGQLGSIMKESVFAAIAWVRSHARSFKLAPDFYQSVDLNVHFPEGAIPKDGPSAGTATVTAITSALTGNPVRSDVAMTGEITLRGDVLAIGGLKEKLLAALRGGVKTVCIPQDNVKDLWDMPESVIKGLKIVPVKTIDEVLDIALVHKPKEFVPTTLEDWTLVGYEKREKHRQMKVEAEEKKYFMEIKDSSEASVKELFPHDGADSHDAPPPSRRRRSRNSADSADGTASGGTGERERTEPQGPAAVPALSEI